jgi:hypothetical protein
MRGLANSSLETPSPRDARRSRITELSLSSSYWRASGRSGKWARAAVSTLVRVQLHGVTARRLPT